MSAMADVAGPVPGGVGAPPGTGPDLEWQHDRRRQLLGGLLWRAGGLCYLVCVALQALVLGVLAGVELVGESAVRVDVLRQVLVGELVEPSLLLVAVGIGLRWLADFVRRPG